MAETEIFKITDGTDEVSFLGPVFSLVRGYRPQTNSTKGGGQYLDPPNQDGRQLLTRSRQNIVDSHRLRMSKQANQDTAAEEWSKLVNLLLKATTYHTKKQWQTSPVWLVRQAKNATNPEYSLIINWQLPDYESPFSAIFARAKMRGLQLTIEHAGWSENPPGTGTAVAAYVYPLAATDTYKNNLLVEGAFGLWKFAETSGLVANNESANSGLDAAYDPDVILASAPNFATGEPSVLISYTTASINLYTSALNTWFDGNEGSAILWVHTSGLIWTSGNEHWFLRIGVDANTEIFIYKTTTDYEIQFGRATSDETTTIETLHQGITNQWFCIAMTWKKNGWMRCYTSGVLVGTEQIWGDWSGSLSSTRCIAGADVLAGDNSASSNLAYLALFDEVLPISKVQEFSRIPYHPLGEENTTNTFVANKHSYEQITHAFHHDNSTDTYSSNLIGSSVPHTLLPATIAVGDKLFIGCQTTDTGVPNGPFDNVIFDLIRGEGFTITPQYYNGSWTALTGFSHQLWDGTNGLLLDGTLSIHWKNPTDWTTTVINGIQAYWIRLRVSAVAGSYTAPQQQNRSIYTCTWPCVHIAASQVGGNYPAKAAYHLTGVRGETVFHNPNIIIAGLRSTDRGTQFTAFLHAADNQLPPGITYAEGGGDWSQANSLMSYVGRRTIYTPPGSTAATNITGPTWIIDNNRASHFAGTFRVFLRVGYDGGIQDDDYAFKLQVKEGDQYFADGQTTETATAITSGSSSYPYQVIDLGQIRISRPDESDMSSIEFKMLLDRGAGAYPNKLYVYDMAIIPIDEWAIETWAQNANAVIGEITAASRNMSSWLEMDGLNNETATILREQDTNWKLTRYTTRQSRPPILQQNADQRLWLLHIYRGIDAKTNAAPDSLLGMQIKRNKQYAGIRGND